MCISIKPASLLCVGHSLTNEARVHLLSTIISRFLFGYMSFSHLLTCTAINTFDWVEFTILWKALF